ncbi:MAG: O-antigen ligase family protein [Clostridia bacterium]
MLSKEVDLISKLKSIIKIIILPLLFSLFFVGESAFGKNMFNKVGILGILLCIFPIIYLLKIKKIPFQITLSYFLLIIYTFLITIFGEDYKHWSISILTISSIAIFSQVTFKEEELRKSMLYTGIMGLIILIVYNYTDILSGWNPNSIGIFSLMSILFLLVSIKAGKKSSKKLTIILLLFSIYQIFLLENRNSLMVLIIAIFALTFINLKKLKKSKIISYAIIGLILPIIFVKGYNLFSQTNLFNEISDTSMSIFGKETLLSGRDSFWIECEELVKNNFWFGKGSSMYKFMYSHNMYYSVVYFFGIIGYILYSFMILKIVSTILKKKNGIITKSLLLIFISILYGQIMENILFTSNENLFMPYLFISLAMSNILEENKDEQE